MRTRSGQVAGAISSILILLAALCVVPLTGKAEETRTALELSPSMDQIVAKPGEVLFRELTVKNLAPIPLPIKAYTRSFIATDDLGGSDYPNDTSKAAAQQWFGIETPDFILQPGATKTLKLVISVPDDAEPGGHYATLFVESLVPKEALSASSLYLATRIGALYFFVIAGDVVEKGSFQKLEIAPFYQHGPVEWSLHFQNEGNVHLQPDSTITIKDWRGRVVYQVQDPGKVTLPQKVRSWKLSWDKKWLFGRYTVTVDSLVAKDMPRQQASEVFWAFPVTRGLGVLAIVIVLTWFIRVGRGRFKRAFSALRGK